MEIVKTDKLSATQYYKAEFNKKHIFLHHTAGASAKSAIQWWNSAPDHVATPFIIERDGTILQLFDPKYWSYALGLKGGTAIEKASIQIEIVAWGPLDNVLGRFYSYAKQEVVKEEVITFGNWRGMKYYHRYTTAQLVAVDWLLRKLIQDFGIKPQENVEQCWNFDEKWQANPKTGIWSHSTVRKDKSDIIPQPELIALLKNLPKC